MKNIILTLFVLTLFGNVKLKAQESNISITAGYPINKTDHWLVGEWENKFNFRVRYYQDRKILSIGGGLNYSKYDIAWFRYVNSDKNSISEISPFLLIGLNLEKNKFTFKPNINVGYTFLSTNIEIYEGKTSAAYFATGLDLNYALSNHIKLGLNTTYNFTLTKLDFGTDDWIITHDFIPNEDKNMKSISIGLNLIYTI